MDKTTLLALAISLAFVAFTSAAILHRFRECSIGTTLRLSLGVCSLSSIIWAATNVARVFGIERISHDFVSTVQIALPAAVCFAFVEMARRMKR